MSVKAMAIAWEADLKPGAKLVLLAIADHADGRGICWPGQDYIAEKCNMNRSTVNQHIGDLVNSGYLFMEKGRSKTGQAVKAVYRVNFEKPTLEKPTLEKPTLEKPTLEKHETNVGKDNIPTLYEPSIEPSYINIITQPEKKQTEKTEKEILKSNGIDGDLARDFLKIRKAKKCPLTETAIKGLLEESAKAGITLKEAITISTKNGWAGFKASWNWQDENSVPKPSNVNTTGNSKNEKFSDKDYGESIIRLPGYPG